jgi:hypothetical protein
MYGGRGNAGDTLFVSGECAIVQGSSALIARVNREAEFDWTMHMLPYYEGTPNAPLNSIIGGASFWVMQSPDRTAEEWQGVAEFFAFISTVEQARSGTSTPATCRSASASTRSSRTRASTPRTRPRHPVPAAHPRHRGHRELERPAPRQHAADPRHHRRGDRDRARTASRPPSRRSTTPSSARTSCSARSSAPTADPAVLTGVPRLGAPAPASHAARTHVREPKGIHATAHHLPQQVLPYLLLAPQLAITVVFFFWPAARRSTSRC